MLASLRQLLVRGRYAILVDVRPVIVSHVCDDEIAGDTHAACAPRERRGAVAEQTSNDAASTLFALNSPAMRDACARAT